MRPGIAEFDAGDIDPEAFSHAEHIRLGWLYLVRYGETDGATRFSTALRRFTTSIGAESRYHETITRFFLEQIADRLDGTDWQCFKAANPDLFDGKTLLEQHYSPASIATREARLRYIEPDRSVRRSAS